MLHNQVLNESCCWGQGGSCLEHFQAACFHGTGPARTRKLETGRKTTMQPVLSVIGPRQPSTQILRLRRSVGTEMVQASEAATRSVLDHASGGLGLGMGSNSGGVWFGSLHASNRRAVEQPVRPVHYHGATILTNPYKAYQYINPEHQTQARPSTSAFSPFSHPPTPPASPSDPKAIPFSQPQATPPPHTKTRLHNYHNNPNTAPSRREKKIDSNEFAANAPASPFSKKGAKEAHSPNRPAPPQSNGDQ